MAQVAFKGKPIRTFGALPKIGSRCPNFVLVDQTLSDRTLENYAGKRKLLYFVPSLDTSVCLTSTQKIDKEMQAISNCVCLIISADLPFAQSRICGHENLKHIITLSTLRSKDFVKDIGLLIDEGPLKGLCARAVFVLDENEQIIYMELVEEVTNEPNYERALLALRQ